MSSGKQQPSVLNQPIFNRPEPRPTWLGLAALVVVAIVATLLSPVVGGTSEVAAADSDENNAANDRYEIVIQDGHDFFILDSATGTRSWAGHCTDQHAGARAVSWDDVKDIPQTETQTCDIIAGWLATPAPAATPEPAPLPQPAQTQAATSGRYEVVIQDDTYWFVLDSVENTKTWAGHCEEVHAGARAVTWNDVKDLVETPTPSCDEISSLLATNSTTSSSPVVAAPVEAAPVEAAPVEAAPVETAPVETAPVEAADRPRMVVSMGDSFISGESGHLIGNNSAQNLGLGVYETGTEDDCRRSASAPINSITIPGVTVENIACSGAVTGDIGEALARRGTRGPQDELLQIHKLEDLAAANDIEMVAVSIGGNDAGFGDFVASCVLAFAQGQSCQDTAGFHENIVENEMRNNVTASLGQIRSVLDDAGHTDARIVLLSYPSPVPAATVYDPVQQVNHGCNFNASDMAYVRKTFVPLMDTTLQNVAANTGVDFLSLVHAFDGKELCSPTTTGLGESSDHSDLEWATGIRGRDAESMHPNALGQEAVGACLNLVAWTNNPYNYCYNNGGDTSDMRLGGVGEVSFDEAAPEASDCVNPDSDRDGDGWGWENGQDCFVSLDDVNCDVGTEAIADRVCRVLLNEINNSLEHAELGFDSSGLLFEYSNPTDMEINDSCSNNLAVTNQVASGVVSSRTDVSITTGSLQDPVAVSVSVPFEVEVDARFRSKQGARIWPFGCRSYSSDSYSVSGNGSGTAELSAILDLQTAISPQPNGDIEVTITPDVLIALDLNDPDIDNLRSRGVNPLAQTLGAAGTIISGTTELTDWVFDGKSLEGIINDRGFALGASVGAVVTSPGIGIVGAPLVEEIAEWRVQQEADGILVQAETDLNAQIREALNAEGGTRTFTIPANIAELLLAGQTIEEVLGL